MEDTTPAQIEAIHTKAKEIYEGIVSSSPDDYDDIDIDDTIKLENAHAAIMLKCVTMAVEMHRAATKCSCIWGPTDSQGVKT